MNYNLLNKIISITDVKHPKLFLILVQLVICNKERLKTTSS